MMMPFEEHIDQRSVECTALFAWCCQRDDKNEAQQRMKQEEERGEFFREYLIWDCKRTGVVAMAHRETTLEKIHEEMIDCIITTARTKKLNNFFFSEKDYEGYVGSYARFATYLRNDSALMMMGEACTLMSTDEFWELMLAKLNKWKSCLLLNGLEKNV